MQSSNTFIRLSGPIPVVRSSALINDYENIIAYWGKIRAKWDVDKQMWFVPNIFGGSEGRCHTRKNLLFLLSFKLRSSIPSTLTQNYFINMNISFS